MPDLAARFGNIDIYLFDQLLRGHIRPGDAVFDAGCGAGRNLVYFLGAGHPVYGVDAHAGSITEVRRLAARLAPALPPENFRAEPLEKHSFPDAFVPVVISSAVLHFSRDEAQFDALLAGSWRVLAPGGLFFCRLASSIGIEGLIEPRGGRRHRLPDGSERYLVDEAYLASRAAALGATLADPLKTTVVSGQRAMTTWVLRKSPGL